MQCMSLAVPPPRQQCSSEWHVKTEPTGWSKHQYRVPWLHAQHRRLQNTHAADCRTLSRLQPAYRRSRTLPEPSSSC